jgi:hypothetical protein
MPKWKDLLFLPMSFMTGKWNVTRRNNYSDLF